MPYLALQGVRVLDVSSGIAGPFCAKMLADYGAEVIKVEPPRLGDASRAVGPFPDDVPHPEKSALYLHLNTNKRGVTLDLESADGVAVFRRLIEESEVLIESFLAGKMTRLGLGNEALKKMKPNLVLTSVTPFGQSGPHKDYEFTELTVFAMGGGMHREGLPDREPLKYGGEIAQFFAGTAAAAATMTALFGAAMTGVGDWIDISIQECMAGHPHQIGRRAPYVYSGESDGRRQPRVTAAGGREPYAVGTFRCKDGYVSFLPLGPRMWPNLARMIEQPELVDDERFATTVDRTELRLELETIFQQWFDVHTRYEVFEAGQREGLPCAPVLDTGEVLDNEQFKSRGFFVDIVHPDVGELTYTGMPFGLSGVPSEEQRPAPRLGQHNLEILGGLLGFSEGELRRLGKEGTI